MTEILTTASSVFTQVASAITGNDYLAVFIGLAILGAGFTVFGRAKRSAQ